MCIAIPVRTMVHVYYTRVRTYVRTLNWLPCILPKHTWFSVHMCALFQSQSCDITLKVRTYVRTYVRTTWYLYHGTIGTSTMVHVYHWYLRRKTIVKIEIPLPVGVLLFDSIPGSYHLVLLLFWLERSVISAPRQLATPLSATVRATACDKQ
jgi:hypothetical protein